MNERMELGRNEELKKPEAAQPEHVGMARPLEAVEKEIADKWREIIRLNKRVEELRGKRAAKEAEALEAGREALLQQHRGLLAERAHLKDLALKQ